MTDEKGGGKMPDQGDKGYPDKPMPDKGKGDDWGKDGGKDMGGGKEMGGDKK